MKKVIIIFVFFYISCFSQTGKIEYSIITKNTIDTTGIRAVLIFNSKESIFIWNSIKTENNKLNPTINVNEKNGKKSIDVKLVYNDTIGKRILNKFSNDNLLLRETIRDTEYFINDTKYNNWELKNETKMIGGFKCLNATINFRGRNYTAWYSPEIPVPAGPWKLNGLPGLIFEVNTEDNYAKITLKKIHYPILKNYKNNFKFFENKHFVSLKQFVDDFDNLNNDILKATLSKLPREVVVYKTDDEKQRTGFEIKFEWEK